MAERRILYTIIVKINGKNAADLAKAAVDTVVRLKARVKTITFDNGLEFPHHENISVGLDTKIYFAPPYSSWERGTKENTNGLIRQYFPKKTDFTQASTAEIDFVMKRLNNRPK